MSDKGDIVKGPKGDKGDDGYTIKGVDYFTVKMVNGKDGEWC